VELWVFVAWVEPRFIDRRVRTLFKESGLTLQGLGEKMGYESDNARQGAFQFMKSNDPRISMLRRVAEALGMTLNELVD
jgi:transcriptional regulator with XRE-family HTH domain